MSQTSSQQSQVPNPDPSYEIETIPPEELHSEISHKGWQPAIQIQNSIAAIRNDQTVQPSEAKGLLKPMAVRKISQYEFKVHDGSRSYSTHMADETCNCGSTNLVMGGRCEHIWHLKHRDQRDLLPSKDSNSTTAPIDCECCGSALGQTKHTIDEISTAVCNQCAISDEDIYHFTPIPKQEPQLVYLADLIANTQADSYYPPSSSMSVYEFFESHPDVDPDDPVVKVHPRSNKTTGRLIFSQETNAVPSSLLQKGIKTLHTLPEEDPPQDSLQEPIEQETTVTDSPPSTPKHIPSVGATHTT